MDKQPDSNSDFEPFELDDKYIITSLVAEGNKGKIFAGETKLTHKKVAIKVLHAALVSNPEVLMRFKLEAEIASTLNHPNIVNVFGSGVTPDGKPYLAMDYVDGQSLEQLLDTQGKIDVVPCINIFVQLAKAVEYTHEKGVIHRDLKPSNIMLRADGHGGFAAKLLDFGVAKSTTVEDTIARELTMKGAVFGSVLYVSPEQVLGKEVDFRSDIYSFGCLLFHALAGRPPYVSSVPVDCMQMHLNEAIPNLADHIPPGPNAEPLASIVNTCMQKDPAHRYQSSIQLRIALERLNEAAPKAPPPVKAPEEPSSTVKPAGFQKADGLGALTIVIIAALFTSVPYFYNLDLSKAESKETAIDKTTDTAAAKEAASATGQKVEGLIQQSDNAISQKNIGDAESLARTAYMTALTLSPDDPKIAEALFQLGKVFEVRGNYQGALQAYEWTYSFRESKFGPMAMQTVEVRQRIKKVQELMGSSKPTGSPPHIRS